MASAAANIGLVESSLTAVKSRNISLLSGVVVVFMNFCFTLAVRALSFHEKWHTRTQHEKGHAVKLSVFYLLNSFLVPILATAVSGNTQYW